MIYVVYLYFSFVIQYDNCLANKVKKEYELDAATFNTIIPLLPLLLRNNFKKNILMECLEFKTKRNCFSTKEHEEGYIVTYKVIEEIENGDKMFDSTYEMFLANAIFFSQSSKGILCHHTLLVFGLKKLSNKYILDRWKKALSTSICSHDPNRLEPVKKCYDGMCKQFYNLVEVVTAFEELTKTVHRILDSVWIMLVEP
ncbi:hypothetical protein Ahy_A04g018379 [Arachis hypogaea]|uniref:Protein FAR1-RELATED SEQUENCE n=1 Tax=Arachis hypogaea TaxID=3818 RepID=A0A445DDJ4_ARAHY|nr:hypothetical protein Ahy_A04g018379 [Arachis hypogaea]